MLFISLANVRVRFDYYLFTNHEPGCHCFHFAFTLLCIFFSFWKVFLHISMTYKVISDPFIACNVVLIFHWIIPKGWCSSLTANKSINSSFRLIDNSIKQPIDILIKQRINKSIKQPIIQDTQRPTNLFILRKWIVTCYNDIITNLTSNYPNIIFHLETLGNISVTIVFKDRHYICYKICC